MNDFTASPHSSVSTTTTRPRTYEVRTFGCQMNVHDSERLAGLLEEAGYVPVGSDDPADVVVFNTCAVRENADNRLYGTLGQLKSVKDTKPDMQIAVGGCMAQKDKDVVVKRAPWVDVVFGTHNIGKLPTLLARAAHNHEAQVEIADALEQFPSVLPAKRDSAYSGWVSVSVGCNNTCTFCIVPSLRGKEKDRRPGDILAEVQTLVDDGVSEVTLLGQNVNAYGVHFEDPTLERDRSAFSKLLRACGDIEGLERVRFTSPHPAEFTSDVIDAMAETHNVCPQLHMPLQSGSDKVLKEMRRSYRTKRFMRILDEVREKLPQASITTDIIVGFPGETEEDFQQTLDLVEKARFTSAYTFQYSPRPGTPAAAMDDQVPKAVVQDRYERLVELQERISAELNAEMVGDVVEVLVQADDGRRSAQTHRLSGRTRDGRLVHFAPDAASMEETARAWNSIGATPMAHPKTPSGVSVEECVKPGVDQAIRAGDVVWVRITDSRSHFLLSDSGVLAHRRMPAGDRTEAASAPTPRGVGLGMPTIKTMKR
ncbi:tRNA (N6-isopentenyl adenosine(37)-C2)-methylthiotransferase MiaB [Corynebacterium sp.]|uniref:tRNA (N6-isopentenyl adenosine(37)-C2)-methylthiotransferase MiaB n=1 Tax=Corynebacterium sp. TaxID=1720 RepID=UPI0026DB7E96|nr:tRNA (N6-isopentenyl adenosine(37)-C2)-methylthiotransferase MiaB [Corynebacterium sp.]MDO4914128.1 tRNA (N6-isopentenyl adenosine(37)-C2)-methylthiotransferase MiaB [Corynebacterium sp.]